MFTVAINILICDTTSEKTRERNRK